MDDTRHYLVSFICSKLILEWYYLISGILCSKSWGFNPREASDNTVRMYQMQLTLCRTFGHWREMEIVVDELTIAHGHGRKKWTPDVAVECVVYKVGDSSCTG